MALHNHYDSLQSGSLTVGSGLGESSVAPGAGCNEIFANGGQYRLSDGNKTYSINGEIDQLVVFPLHAAGGCTEPAVGVLASGQTRYTDVKPRLQ